MDSISEIMKENSNDEFSNFSNSQKNEVKKQNMSQNSTSKIKHKPDQHKINKNTFNKKLRLLESIDNKLSQLISLIQENTKEVPANEKAQQTEKKIKGVLEGQKMIGADTNKYEVPPSLIKNKNLVEGDLLRLTLKKDGCKDYEIIGTVERERTVGTAVKKNGWKIKTQDGVYQVREDLAEIYGLTEGMKVVILIPKNGRSNWATIENVF